MRIVFFGTPDFAVATLDQLVKAGYPPTAVVTAPDKPAGRGRKLQASAVKQYAEQHDMEIFQPPNLKDLDFLHHLRSLEAELFIVVAFRMLPEVVWNMPPMGTVNLHASLLPAYRGAAPIQWAIMQGEPETGVTTFRLCHAIDTGDLLLQRRTPIGPHENAGSLYQRLMQMGADLVVETVQGLKGGGLQPRPQPPVPPGKEAPKIKRHHGQIDWTRDALEVHNQIRGLSPKPGAFTHFEGMTVKMLKSTYGMEAPSLDRAGEAKAGFFFWEEKSLRIRCGKGTLMPLMVQLEGRKAMDLEALYNGRLLNSGQFTWKAIEA